MFKKTAKTRPVVIEVDLDDILLSHPDWDCYLLEDFLRLMIAAYKKVPEKYRAEARVANGYSARLKVSYEVPRTRELDEWEKEAKALKLRRVAG